MEITSVGNDYVKECSKLLQKKYRSETGKFLLEGYKPIYGAINSGIKVEHIFADEKHFGEYDFAKDLIIKTNSAVLKKLSSTQTPPPAVAVAYQKKWDLGLLKDCKKVVLLENIKDAGNLGTILRSAVAFGADGVILYGDCVDLYNPKCVRSAVGNLWKIPVVSVQKLTEINGLFSSFTKIATLPRSKKLLKKCSPKFPVIVLFGSEADGLSEELIGFSNDSVKIEMSKDVESLNLATSVSVILYELFTD